MRAWSMPGKERIRNSSHGTRTPSSVWPSCIAEIAAAILLPPMPRTRARIGVIFFTVLIALIGFGIILPILPFYTQRFGAAGLGYGAVVGVFSLMQFVATALLGKLSDRIGRRPVLLTTMLVNAIGYTLFAFAGSYWVLFLSRIVSGFAGGNISAAQAYMADITSPAERSRGMGIVGAAFGIGFSFGPAIGGFAAHYGGGTRPGPVARGLCAAAALGWKERELAILFTIIGVTAASVQGYFFGKIVRRTGERALVIAGTFGMAAAIGVVPFLSTSAMLYAWTFVLAYSIADVDRK